MRLLLVEDDSALAEAVMAQLREQGFVLDRAATCEDAAQLLAGNQYGALVLDLGLPDGDGLTLLRDLRQRGQTLPVIMLTARTEIASRIAGLDAGADDYVTKPFSPGELAARLRAVLRRNGSFQGPELACGNLRFDPQALMLHVEDKPVSLSQREGTLLGLLLRRAGQVVTKKLAEDQLFGAGGDLGSNAIEVYVHRLRHKLLAGGGAVEIVTIRGVGYLLKALP